MLHIVREDNLHRTITRLFAMYDVVVIDLPLERDDKSRWNFHPFERSIRNLINGISNYGAFNQVEPMLVAGRIPKDDHENALHVVTGLSALSTEDRNSTVTTIMTYSEIKSHPGQRLLVLTDSLTALESPHAWMHRQDIAIVHVEGQ